MKPGLGRIAGDIEEVSVYSDTISDLLPRALPDAIRGEYGVVRDFTPW